MKQLTLLLILTLYQSFSFSQSFDVDHYTMLHNGYIANEFELIEGLIKIEHGVVNTKTVSEGGNYSKGMYTIVEWHELEDSKNKKLELNESLTVLADDGSKVKFSFKNVTLYGGETITCLSFYQPYTNIEIRYTLSETIEGESKKELVSKWKSEQGGEISTMEMFYDKTEEFPLSAILKSQGYPERFIVSIDKNDIYHFYNPVTFYRVMFAELKKEGDEYKLYFNSGLIHLTRTYVKKEN